MSKRKTAVVMPAIKGIASQRLWGLQVAGLALLCAVPVLNVAGLAMVAERHRELCDGGAANAAFPLLRLVDGSALLKGLALALLDLAVLGMLLAVLTPAFDAAQLDDMRLRVEFIVFGAWPVPAATASSSGVSQLLAIVCRLAAVYGTCLASLVASAICRGRGGFAAVCEAIRQPGAKGRVFKTTCLPLLAYSVFMVAALMLQQAAGQMSPVFGAVLVLACTGLGLNVARTVVCAAVAEALRW